MRIISFLRRNERPLSKYCLSGGELLRGEDPLPDVVADGVHDEPAALGGVGLLVVRGGRSGHHGSNFPPSNDFGETKVN